MSTSSVVTQPGSSPRDMSNGRLVAHQLRYDLLVIWRDPQSRFFTLALPLIFLVLLTSLFGNHSHVIDGQVIKNSTYYVPGICTLGIIATSFVNLVITLVAQAEAVGSMREIDAFATPTVVQFVAALLISAIMTAPWHTLSHAAICLAVIGALAILYSLKVISHARNTTAYQPDPTDWLWYVIAPPIVYVAVMAGAILLWLQVGTWPMFVIAAAAIVFLFLGIRNAWDTVTYVAVSRRQRSSEQRQPS